MRIILDPIPIRILAVRDGDIGEAGLTLRLNALPCRLGGKIQNRGIMALVRFISESVIIFYFKMRRI